MIEPGRGWAYLALFSEIGISLLVTTLVGVLFGYWVDGQLGTTAVFCIIGFFARRRGRDRDDLQIGHSVPRNHRITESTSARPAEDRARRDAALLCVEQSVSSEQVATRGGRRGPSRRSRSGRGPWPVVSAGSSSSVRVIVVEHRGAHPVPAVPQGRRARRGMRVSRLLHQRHARVPGAPRRLGLAPERDPPPADLVTFHPSISSTILTMWIVMVVVLAGAILMTRGRGGCIPGRAPEPLRVVLRVPGRFRPRHRRGRRASRTSRCSSRSSCSSCSTTGSG